MTHVSRRYCRPSCKRLLDCAPKTVRIGRRNGHACDYYAVQKFVPLLLSKVLLVCHGSALQYLLTNLGGQQSEIPNLAAATYLNART